MMRLITSSSFTKDARLDIEQWRIFPCQVAQQAAAVAVRCSGVWELARRRAAVCCIAPLAGKHEF